MPRARVYRANEPRCNLFSPHYFFARFYLGQGKDTCVVIDELFDSFALDNYIKKILFYKNRYRKELFELYACSVHGYANTSGKGRGGDASLQRDSRPLPMLA